jgi:hypothetical protein
MLQQVTSPGIGSLAFELSKQLEQTPAAPQSPGGPQQNGTVIDRSTMGGRMGVQLRRQQLLQGATQKALDAALKKTDLSPELARQMNAVKAEANKAADVPAALDQAIMALRLVKQTGDLAIAGPLENTIAKNEALATAAEKGPSAANTPPAGAAVEMAALQALSHALENNAFLDEGQMKQLGALAESFSKGDQSKAHELASATLQTLTELGMSGELMDGLQQAIAQSQPAAAAGNGAVETEMAALQALSKALENPFLDDDQAKQLASLAESFSKGDAGKVHELASAAHQALAEMGLSGELMDGLQTAIAQHQSGAAGAGKQEQTPTATNPFADPPEDEQEINSSNNQRPPPPPIAPPLKRPSSSKPENTPPSTPNTTAQQTSQPQVDDTSGQRPPPPPVPKPLPRPSTSTKPANTQASTPNTTAEQNRPTESKPNSFSRLGQNLRAKLAANKPGMPSAGGMKAKLDSTLAAGMNKLRDSKLNKLLSPKEKSELDTLLNSLEQDHSEKASASKLKLLNTKRQQIAGRLKDSIGKALSGMTDKSKQEQARTELSAELKLLDQLATPGGMAPAGGSDKQTAAGGKDKQTSVADNDQQTPAATSPPSTQFSIGGITSARLMAKRLAASKQTPAQNQQAPSQATGSPSPADVLAQNRQKLNELLAKQGKPPVPEPGGGQKQQTPVSNNQTPSQATGSPSPADVLAQNRQKLNELLAKQGKPPVPEPGSGQKQQTPVNNNQTPVNNNQTPVNNNQTPVSNDQTPVDNDQKPVSNDQTPVSNDQTPVDNNQTPVDNDQTPVDNDQKPVDNDQTPPANGQKPQTPHMEMPDPEAYKPADVDSKKEPSPLDALNDQKEMLLQVRAAERELFLLEMIFKIIQKAEKIALNAIN